MKPGARIASKIASLTLTGAVVAGCTVGEQSVTPPVPSPFSPSSPSSPSSAGPTSTGPASTGPTSTNTLPAPAPPNEAAPTSSGPLTDRALPVPDRWRTVVREGGVEEGYRGNGTWVHGRDPRYAAQDVITLGCAPVTRDDYPDPVAALEGTYRNAADEPGVGLVLEFASAEAAGRFYRRYLEQLRACTNDDGPVRVKLVDSDLGLIDRRTYPDSEWTEVGRLYGRRLTLLILTDTGHAIDRSTAEALVAEIRPGR